MDKNIKGIIGEKIKELREEEDITQRELSKIIGASSESISQYERGQQTPKPQTLIKLADHFNVSIDYIFGRADAKNSYILEKYKDKNLDVDTINKIIEILTNIK